MRKEAAGRILQFAAEEGRDAARGGQRVRITGGFIESEEGASHGRLIDEVAERIGAVGAVSEGAVGAEMRPLQGGGGTLSAVETYGPW